MASLIESLPPDVVAAFVSEDAKERVSQIADRVDAIEFGMGAVFAWLERRRTQETSDRLRHRLLFVLAEASACAGLDIPHYAGGVIQRASGEPTEGALRTGGLVVLTTLFASSLREWATEIEGDDTIRRAKESSATRIVSGVAHSASEQTPSPRSVDPGAYLGAAAIAKMFNLPQNALEQRLKRWRANNMVGDGWIEDTERKPREPKFLYRVADITQPVIDRLQRATDETTGE
jgi:hypothetical protein